MDKVPHIFLSYARPDRSRVEQLYARLDATGLTPWMDTQDILPGERWENRIREAMRQADFILFCLSPASVDRRGFLQRELRTALEQWQEKLEDDIYLIPILLEACEIPDSLRPFQWVDIWEDGGWERLLRALHVGLARRGKKVPSAVAPLPT